MFCATLPVTWGAGELYAVGTMLLGFVCVAVLLVLGARAKRKQDKEAVEDENVEASSHP